MRIIPTYLHGILDYAMGVLLIVAPYILGFADGTAAQYVPQALGLATLLMSLMTDYELSITKVIPMSVHLGVDIASGLLLAISPWLFGFADRVSWPHLILGIAEVGAALMTQTCPHNVDLKQNRV
ncbi:SPW repeat domain-containing protein [Methylobacterium sp. CM6247]